MNETKIIKNAILVALMWLIPFVILGQNQSEQDLNQAPQDTGSLSNQEYIQALEGRERAVQELRNLLRAEGGSLNEELVLDVQTILTQLRNPKFDIKIERPSIDIPIDDSKLGGIREYIEEKTRQTFYKIKIDDIEVEPIE